jgi:WD40 repeat protein
VTDQPLDGKIIPNQVSVVLQDGQQSYTLRTLPANAPNYVLNLAQYAGDWYMAVGASNDSAVYIYKDPQSQPATGPDTYPAPWRRLSINNPTYLSFSSNTQFLLAESGENFVVYDLENVLQYSYNTGMPLDQPQTHAMWMDGDRLTYVSGGKLVVFDYDERNRQTLMEANPDYMPLFDTNYTHVYAIAPLTPTVKDLSTIGLTSTWLLTPADQ